LLKNSRNPIVLAGHGAARSDSQQALTRFAEDTNASVATTFMGKGVFPDDHPNALGTVGFMHHDYVNFGFDMADLLLCVGYDMQEFDPIKINPNNDKQIIHISTQPAEVDSHYTVTVGIQGDISQTLHELTKGIERKETDRTKSCKIQSLLRQELEYGKQSESFPVKPQRIVHDIRKALGSKDIVLVDTGALKMWMGRLYPTYSPNTCLISNGLSTMSFALPGAIGVKLAKPECKVLAATGDGGFLMLGNELATAVREKVPIVVLIWEDQSYGLIKWKMDTELGHHSGVDFKNPDFVRYAESFGAKGYRVKKPQDLLPLLFDTLADTKAVSVITCPVDYSENIKLTKKLGEISDF
jgi:acetolactate synthase-1/2/3 large subunit